jgi:hypothetical protein
MPLRIVILMTLLLGAGGPMQLSRQCSGRSGLHRSSGLQKSAGHQDDTVVSLLSGVSIKWMSS